MPSTARLQGKQITMTTLIDKEDRDIIRLAAHATGKESVNRWFQQYIMPVMLQLAHEQVAYHKKRDELWKVEFKRDDAGRLKIEMNTPTAPQDTSSSPAPS